MRINLTRIFALLRERTRVDFTFYKPSTVVRRIERRMTVNQIHDLRDYVKFMESYSGEVMTLYRDLLIGVTSFFRDREVFDELETQYLPRCLSALRARKSGSGWRAAPPAKKPIPWRCSVAKCWNKWASGWTSRFSLPTSIATPFCAPAMACIPRASPPICRPSY
jgi:hypothetical protein